MGESSEASGFASGRRLARASSLLAFGCGLALLAAPAAAQRTPPPLNTEPPTQQCRVYALDAPADQPRELRANCRGQGFLMGRATGFETVENESLNATLVDIRLGSSRRVLMLSIQPDGTGLVEDLTGQIALAAGRGPMSEIDGIELDLRGFERTGEIGVRGRPQDAGSRKVDRIDLSRQITAERSRRGAALIPQSANPTE